jgi:RNA polymerase sigma factor (sigma-70 family)
MSTQDTTSLDLHNLAKNHHNKLLYFVLHKVRNEEDARDIVQSTFVEAIRSVHNFRFESKPETWLTGIAINLIKNHFYQQKQKPTFYLEDEIILDETQEDEYTPEKNFMHRQLIQGIERVFAHMSKEMQYTAEQVILNDASYEEASFEKNNKKIPIGTVRSRVARAREMLRKLKATIE